MTRITEIYLQYLVAGLEAITIYQLYKISSFKQLFTVTKKTVRNEKPQRQTLPEKRGYFRKFWCVPQRILNPDPL